MGFNGKSLIIIGTLLFFFQIANFISIETITPELGRAQVLAAIASLIIILIGFLFKQFKPITGEKADLKGDNKFFYDKNIPIELRVVGPKKDKLPNHPCLKYVGFIDKSLELERFVKEITSWHFGTLFSKAEAYGISNRECMILGVPVICHDVGGISSTLPKSNYGKIFEANPNPAIVFEWVIDILSPYDKYISLRKNLLKQHQEFTWDKAVLNIKKIIDKDN